MDERELDRIGLEAEHDHDFRLAALVRQLREHRAMLRRYLIAHAVAARARPGQRQAATQTLIEAYNDAWQLLGKPAPRAIAESSQTAVTAPRVRHVAAREVSTWSGRH